MGNWYVVVTKTGRGDQDKAEYNLLGQSFETFNPKLRVETYVDGFKRIITEMAFPGYLFVKFDPAIRSASKINHTLGVSKLLTFGDVMVPMQDADMDALKTRFETRPVIDLLPKQGEKVEIGSGPLAGVEAVFDEPDGMKRSFLLLKFVGLEKRVSIDNSAFA